MNILILHLSDIHFKSDRRKNKILERANSIVSVISRAAASARSCFIVISGDIAFSGEVNQYEQASELILVLKGALTEASPGIEVHVIVVPGNHDCNFSASSGTRTFILENLGLKDADSINEGVVRDMTAVQDAFFTFAAEVESASPLEGLQRLFYERRFDVDGFAISFHCLNAAWMSQLHEPQGQMIFPIHLVQWDDDDTDLTITVFHHPDRWLESSNARPFRENVEHASNFILTGHEHAADRYTKQNRAGAVSEYIEGAVLQDSDDPWTSGFNLIEIEPAAKTKRVSTYVLGKDGYRKAEESDWKSFDLTLRLRAKNFINNAAYAEKLNETGLPLSHRSQHTLTLNDIFIYPDLDALPIDKKRDEGVIDIIIPSERAPYFAMEQPLLAITGPDQSGRTSLAKMFYRRMQELGMVPVMINGTDIKSVKEEDLLKLIDQQFARQYDKEQLHRYRELHRDKRALIIDDFDHTGIRSREGHSSIIEVLRRHYDRITIFVSDLFQFAELAQGAEIDSELNKFRLVGIREFGSQLRYRLITKWARFDRDPSVSDQELEREIDDYANKASTLVVRKTVPSYPIILLSMLQMFDLNQEVADKGEFGYFYESYIIQKLRQSKTPSLEMGTVVGYTAHLAYWLFDHKTRMIGSAELADFTHGYRKQFSVSFSEDNILSVLEQAEVLRPEADGTYRFKHRFVYYYFVAKYIAMNLYRAAEKRSLRKKLNVMAEQIHVDDFYFILLFLVYLTNDEQVVAKLMENGDSFYSDHDPCDLDEHVRHINSMPASLPPLSLQTGDTLSNRDEYEGKRDGADPLEEFEHPDEVGDLAARHEFDEFMQINVAFRTLQIMGSVLRNFPGALEGEVKRRLALGSYRLGLRILRYVLVVIEENAEYFHEIVAGWIKDLHGITDSEQAANRIRQLMFELQAGLGYGIIKKISQSVGSRHLSETYREVLTEDNAISLRMVDTAIKLDHFLSFPRAEVEGLYEEVKANSFAMVILRTLVRDRFYLFTQDAKLRQSICNLLGIKLNDPKMIEGRTKR